MSPPDKSGARAWTAVENIRQWHTLPAALLGHGRLRPLWQAGSSWSLGPGVAVQWNRALPAQRQRQQDAAIWRQSHWPESKGQKPSGALLFPDGAPAMMELFDYSSSFVEATGIERPVTISCGGLGSRLRERQDDVMIVCPSRDPLKSSYGPTMATIDQYELPLGQPASHTDAFQDYWLLWKDPSTRSIWRDLLGMEGLADYDHWRQDGQLHSDDDDAIPAHFLPPHPCFVTSIAVALFALSLDGAHKLACLLANAQLAESQPHGDFEDHGPLSRQLHCIGHRKHCVELGRPIPLSKRWHHGFCRRLPTSCFALLQAEYQYNIIQYDANTCVGRSPLSVT